MRVDVASPCPGVKAGTRATTRRDSLTIEEWSESKADTGNGAAKTGGVATASEIDSRAGTGVSGLGHLAAIVITDDSSNSLVMNDGARAVTGMQEIGCVFNGSMLR